MVVLYTLDRGGWTFPSCLRRLWQAIATPLLGSPTSNCLGSVIHPPNWRNYCYHKPGVLAIETIKFLINHLLVFAFDHIVNSLCSNQESMSSLSLLLVTCIRGNLLQTWLSRPMAS